MFYEGTEKRLEIILKQDILFEFPETFWERMVDQAGASLISKIRNEQVVAYLLSESSLFVWKNKLLLITCGNTQLVKAAHFFLNKQPKEQIQSLIFHRHQAIRPGLQKSNFDQDLTILSSNLQGGTHYWQGKDQGDLFFFGELTTQERNYKQLLMLQGLSGSFAEELHTGSLSAEQIADMLVLSKYFPEQEFDHFAFNPQGYSLNMISDNKYLTIHITPEKLSTYLSIESSFDSKVIDPFIRHLMQLFTPMNSNLLTFDNDLDNTLIVSLQPLRL